MFVPRMFEPEKKIVIFSGAGLDAPSGIQTFRDSNGLWNNHNVSEICNENNWVSNWQKVHNFYNGLRKDLPTFQPNAAHYIIKRIIDKYGKDNVFNITMNISDMFERIETPVLHLHGELTKMECTNISCNHNWNIGYNEFSIETGVCPKCGTARTVRPHIVFFDGQAPMYSYLYRALDYLDHPDSILLVIGTTGSVVDVDMMTKGRSCTKILVDVKKPSNINIKKFQHVLLNGSIEGLIEAEKIIYDKWD